MFDLYSEDVYDGFGFGSVALYARLTFMEIVRFTGSELVFDPANDTSIVFLKSILFISLLRFIILLEFVLVGLIVFYILYLVKLFVFGIIKLLILFLNFFS